MKAVLVRHGMDFLTGTQAAGIARDFVEDQANRLVAGLPDLPGALPADLVPCRQLSCVDLRWLRWWRRTLIVET